MPASSDDEHFIFGYGSIIWRPNMPHMMSVPGYVPGWRRRFWQASPDHRGYPEAPGRVVTLLRHAESTTWGMVFQVDAQHMENVLAELDHREKAGYERTFVDIFCVDGKRRSALVFAASEANAHFAGPAPLDEIAAVIDRSQGPSGPNDEYLLELAMALPSLGVIDPHIAALERCLTARRRSRVEAEEAGASLLLYNMWNGIDPRSADKAI